MTIIDSVKSISLKYQSNKNKGDLTMKRFVKEYASFIKKTHVAKDAAEKVEFDNTVDKVMKLENRGLITTLEAMAKLTKMGDPDIIKAYAMYY